MPNGKLLVLDGLDGSGKSTQFELLQTALQKQGVSIQAVSFPDYDSPSAALVKMYLNGELSNTPDGVNAYAASSFYAVDRYANYHLHWEQAYHNGTCILASRYTTSNAIYQMGKLPKSEWDNYLQWLAEYEYGRLELPEPDTVIYLDMPVSVQQALLFKRYGRRCRKERFARSRHCLSVAVPAGGLLRSGEAGLESAAMQPERRTAAP